MTKLSSVSTLKEGTVVVLEKKVRSRKRHPSGIEIIAFFDKNNNGRLDRKDMISRSVYGSRQCPLRGQYKSSGMMHFGYCSKSVTALDVISFGARVSKLFSQAKKERASIRKSISAQSVGTCVVGGQDIARRFNPPLSILTKRVSKGRRYVKTQVMSLKSINPSRCDAAYSKFSMLLGGKSKNVRFAMNNAAGPIFARLFESFGLSNSAAHVDASFVRGAVDVHHIDLNK